MKISTILDHIDSGHMALPEFQRGYVWNRDQVRGLVHSLYKRHPVGSLLVWVTRSEGAPARGDAPLAPGVVKLILDGQQRITSLYGLIRGAPPRFFDGNAHAFRGLYFHLDTEELAFSHPTRMHNDPLWIDVTKLMRENVGAVAAAFATKPEYTARIADYFTRLTALRSIQDIDLHIEEVTGADKTVEVVVDIFNRVNSGGTKLSKGDLALAKVCVEVPDARDRMKSALQRWRKAGYDFDLDWLLRSVNTVALGKAKFSAMHEIDAQRFSDGLVEAERSIEYLLDAVDSRLGVDHDRVLFGKLAFPVMAHYVHHRGGKLSSAAERDKLLFWYLQSAIWGRFSGSTETFIDRDLTVLEEGGDSALDKLLDELRLWRGGGLRVLPEHFGGWSLGARFYPLLYILTRVGSAQDWGNGILLKNELLGKKSRLEMHHIFPKSVLRRAKYPRSEVNAIANFCFLAKSSNLEISDRLPEEYFAEIQERFPGALESQWIPMDPQLWRVDRYRDFLDARRSLLADATNGFFAELLHGEARWLEGARPAAPPNVAPSAAAVPGGIDSEQEEEALEAANEWVQEQGLPAGVLAYELNDESSGESLAILDLAWPRGLQEGFSQPVALLLNEGAEVHRAANAAGFRYFTSTAELREYVQRDVLALGAE